MKILTLILFLATTLAAWSQPRLVRDGSRAHLVVSGQPMIILGGELSNSAATSKADIDSVMPRMARLGLNTVLVPAQWDLVEPEEGRYDFSLIDEAIHQARANNLKVVFLWFGAWKNSMSCYAPLWVKRDTHRFPRACGASGRPQEIVTAFSDNLFRADSTVFTRLMRHIRDVDAKEQTVIMLQVENEIGMLESARDHCALAETAYRRSVPDDFLRIKHLTHRGTWQQVLGTGDEADEQFQAYWYARYVERLAHAAKRVYALPLYVNAAMNSRGRRPGQYPSAGPLPHLFDIWQGVAKDIDLLSPDIYDTGFPAWASRYAKPTNALFIPESRCCDNSGVRAIYTFGAHEAVGFCPFAIDQAAAHETGQVSRAYALLRELSPLLLSHRGQGRVHGVLFDQQQRDSTLTDDGLTLPCHHVFTLPWDPRATDGSTWREGGAIIMQLNSMEYIVAGSGVMVEFSQGQTTTKRTALGEDGFALNGTAQSTNSNDSEEISASQTNMKQKGTGSKATTNKDNSAKRSSQQRIGLGSVAEVRISSDGHLVPLRWLNGDQTHQGRHVRIGLDDYQILWVKLYKY